MRFFNYVTNASALASVSAAVPAALAAALPLFSGDTAVEVLRSIL